MEWIEVIVHTTTAGTDIVSERLREGGAQGTMAEDRADVPDPAKPNGFWEIIDPHLIDGMPEDVLVHAWYEPEAGLRDRIAALETDLSALKTVIPEIDFGSLRVETVHIPEENWAEEWKKYFKPFRAGESLVVKPTWETYEAQPGDKVIEIDPGMAFGSGTHETTGMCLTLLERAIRGGERVIDVGTGSGILAIGAALLGASGVLAIDIDPQAVKVAKENIAHNGLSGKIEAVEGNLLDRRDVTCDVCVANIIASVICGFAEPLKAHIAPGGTFICSGIIREREADVNGALLAAGYQIREIRRRGEWVAFRAVRP